MGNYKQNHSRNLNYYGYGMDCMVEREIRKPTKKQITFYARLRHLCDENNVDRHGVGDNPRSRAGFSLAIDSLITRLRDAGVDIGAGRKEAEVIYTVPDPCRINGGVPKERIVVKNAKGGDARK